MGRVHRQLSHHTEHYHRHHRKRVGYQPVAKKTLLSTLCFGIVVGLSFSYLLLYWSQLYQDVKKPASRGRRTRLYLEHSQDENDDGERFNEKREFHTGKNHVALELAYKVRVLCWVMTSPKNHETRAKSVKETWGRRCNILLFMSSEFNKELPTVALPVKNGRNYLWNKTKEAFRYAYDHYYNEADWFLKADDDTYIVVENLRYLLSDYNSSEPTYFGCRFKPYVDQGYMSGGAGYVLSKGALKRFVEDALTDPRKCRPDAEGTEDVEMGKCMQNVKVFAMDSRDSLGRGRFFPFVPEQHLIAKPPDPGYWYWKNIYYPITHGIDCCSDTVISFHYIVPDQMYVMDYLIYHMRPYGISHVVRGAGKHFTAPESVLNNSWFWLSS